MSVRKFRCIAVTSPSFSKHKRLVSELSDLAERVVVNETTGKWTEDGIIEWLNQHQADGVIVGTDPFSSRVIDRLLHVKAVGKYGVGCDNVDILRLKERGIYFGWEGGVNRRSVSELALAFMLSHCRNVFRTVDKMQRGIWDKNGGVQLSDRTIGIVGLGFIGTDLAMLLRAFGCKVLYYDIADQSSVAKQLGLIYAPYNELVQQVDILTFHVPGGTATRHMFGEAQIAMASAHLLVVNTARGHVIDFSAVSTAVKSKRLGGYASDVFPEEPFLSNDYPMESGFYFTPHIGGNAEEAVLAMGRSAIKGLRDFLQQS